MENKEEKYQYSSIEEYCEINKDIINELKEENEDKQKSIIYNLNLLYYDDYEMYYIEMPEDYLNNIDNLRENKEDIFSKGKILTFTGEDDFVFDAVVDSTEDDFYAYIVPIKEKYRYSVDLIGNYSVNERTGDLTYHRMKQAVDEFQDGETFSKHLERYILGKDISNISNKSLFSIFNYNRFYMENIRDFARLSRTQSNKLNNIFYNEMNTIKLKSNTNPNIVCLIIYAIYQMRKNVRDKILVCSSSNNEADSIALDLLNMKEYVKKLNILRIYAKNQEIIKRNKRLDEISFHKLVRKKFRRRFYDRDLKKKWIIKKKDIIISTCVNSYNDDIINYPFPFVIIIDANNSTENENLIPLTLNAKHVILIAYEESDNGEFNLYKRMSYLYPNNHCVI